MSTFREYDLQPPDGLALLMSVLGDLQRTFGAQVLDVTDDSEGAILVDVRIAAEAARRHWIETRSDQLTELKRQARLVSARAVTLCLRSFEACETARLEIVKRGEIIAQRRALVLRLRTRVDFLAASREPSLS